MAAIGFDVLILDHVADPFGVVQYGLVVIVCVLLVCIDSNISMNDDDYLHCDDSMCDCIQSNCSLLRIFAMALLASFEIHQMHSLVVDNVNCSDLVADHSDSDHIFCCNFDNHLIEMVDDDMQLHWLWFLSMQCFDCWLDLIPLHFDQCYDEESVRPMMSWLMSEQLPLPPHRLSDV